MSQATRWQMRGGLSRTTDVPIGLPEANAGAAVDDRWLDVKAQVRRLSWSLLYAGFLLYVFVMTTYQFKLGDLGVAMALVGLLFNARFRFPAFLWLYVLLLAWCGIGLLQTWYPDVVKDELINLVKLALILLAAVNALQTRSQIRFFIIFWLACYALYPVRGTYLNYFVAGYTTFGRALWNYIYANPNDLAALTILQLSLCAGVLVTDQTRWVRRLALVGTFVLVLLVFMTQSRGGILGVSVFALFALVGHRRRLHAVSLAAVALVVLLMAAPSDVWSRLQRLGEATGVENLAQVDEEGSAQQRYQIWRVAAQIIRDNWAFGVGWGAYPYANAAYAPGTATGARLGARDTHSTYLNIWAEAGLVGIIVFLGIIGTVVVYADKVRRSCKRFFPKAAQQLYFAELGLLGFLIAGIFASYSRLSFLYLHMVLMYAMAHSCAQELRALPLAAARSVRS